MNALLSAPNSAARRWRERSRDREVLHVRADAWNAPLLRSRVGAACTCSRSAPRRAAWRQVDDNEPGSITPSWTGHADRPRRRAAATEVLVRVLVFRSLVSDAAAKVIV